MPAARSISPSLWTSGAPGLEELAAAGPMALHVEVTKSRRPDDRDRAIMTLCAWAPFACPTARNGLDGAIRDEVLTLRRFENLGEVALEPGRDSAQARDLQGLRRRLWARTWTAMACSMNWW